MEFKDIWIMKTEGIAFVHAEMTQSNENFSTNLFTGFLSAVQNMAADSIDAIKMKGSIIIIVPMNKPIKFFVVGRASAKDKDKDVRKELIKIGENFVAQFKDVIENWDCDVGRFDSFKEKLEKQYGKR